MKTLTQNEQILNYLLSGRTLTSLQALDNFNCMRLAARISDLSKKGYPINSEMVTKSGKRFAEYSLNESYKPL